MSDDILHFTVTVTLIFLFTLSVLLHFSITLCYYPIYHQMYNSKSSFNRSPELWDVDKLNVDTFSFNPKISSKTAFSMMEKLLFSFHGCNGVVKHSLTPSSSGENTSCVQITSADLSVWGCECVMMVVDSRLAGTLTGARRLSTHK